nr:hypothetical protein [Tanacetum cinerariifolium]
MLNLINQRSLIITVVSLMGKDERYSSEEHLLQQVMFTWCKLQKYIMHLLHLLHLDQPISKNTTHLESGQVTINVFGDQSSECSETITQLLAPMEDLIISILLDTPRPGTHETRSNAAAILFTISE